MYNKAKRTLGLVAGIISIIIGVFQFVGAILSLIGSIGIAQAVIIFLSTLGLAFSAMLVFLGVVLCKKPIITNGEAGDKKAYLIALMVTILCYSFYNFIELILNLAYGFISAIGEFWYVDCFMVSLIFNYFNLFITLPALVLCIVAICIKGKYVQAPVNQAPLAQQPQVATPQPVETPATDNLVSVYEKINQLNHLRSLGAISDEQRDVAVEKLVNEIVK